MSNMKLTLTLAMALLTGATAAIDDPTVIPNNETLRPVPPGTIRVQEGARDYLSYMRPKTWVYMNDRSILFDWDYDRRLLFPMAPNSTLQVTRPPSRGYLTTEEDNTKLADLDYMIQGPVELLYYAYPFDSDESARNDTFTFRVADENGTWSEEATATIEILSGLKAFNSSNIHKQDVPFVNQNTPTRIELYGLDYSELDRSIRFQITSLPPAHAGTIVDDLSGQPLLPGSLLSGTFSAPYERGAALRFFPAPGYHNYPCSRKTGCNKNDMPITFGFRVIAVDKRGNIVSASAETPQEIKVRNVNSPPEVTGPTDTVTVQRDTRLLPIDMKMRCKDEVILKQLAEKGSHDCPIRHVVQDVDVSDLDDDTSVVRVQLRSNGRLCLHPRNRGKMNSSACYKGEANCGSALCNVGVIDFYALPSDINDILADLSYKSFKTGQDTIEIQVFDGEGEDCMDDRRFRNYNAKSVHSGCFNVQHTIDVEVLPANYTIPVLKTPKLPARSLIPIIFTAVSLLALLFTVVTAPPASKKKPTSPV